MKTTEKYVSPEVISWPVIVESGVCNASLEGTTEDLDEEDVDW